MGAICQWMLPQCLPQQGSGLKFAPQVIPTTDASMGHRAIRSLGLLGGGLARSADADLFAEVPRGLHEPLFLANSA